jgi:hypothetical protein
MLSGAFVVILIIYTKIAFPAKSEEGFFKKKNS